MIFNGGIIIGWCQCHDSNLQHDERYLSWKDRGRWCEFPKHTKPMDRWFDEDGQEFWFCPDCTQIPGYNIPGIKTEKKWKTCQKCDGTGIIWIKDDPPPPGVSLSPGTWQIEDDCPKCGGIGEL